MTSFRVRPVDPRWLRRVRARGADDAGNPLEPLVAAEDGAPLRCCLRDAVAGERIVLLAYRPDERGGPYSEVGPIFVHAQECAGYREPAAYPPAFRHRTQVFRAYGPDGRIVDAEIVAGADAEKALGRLLARPDVGWVHSRNVGYGCFMFAVERAA